MQNMLRDLHGITIEDPDSSGEQRCLTIGMDALGRVLVVVHTPRDERTRIVSARKATRGEAVTYHA
jgi:uncharacterized DUF497 family protein